MATIDTPVQEPLCARSRLLNKHTIDSLETMCVRKIGELIETQNVILDENGEDTYDHVMNAVEYVAAAKVMEADEAVFMCLHSYYSHRLNTLSILDIDTHLSKNADHPGLLVASRSFARSFISTKRKRRDSF